MASQNARNPFVRLLLALGFISMVVVGLMQLRGRNDSNLPEGVSREHYQDAERRFAQMFGENPHPPDVFSMLGKTAVEEGRFETALACFRAVPIEHTTCGLDAKLQEGVVLIRLNRAPAAEQAFKTYLGCNQVDGRSWEEDLETAREWLSFLYSVQMRFEERKPILLALQESGHASVFESKQLYFPSLLIWSSSTGRERLRQFLTETPDDPQLNLSEARYLTREGRLAESLSLLEKMRKRLGDDRRCLSAILECHFESNDWSAFREAMRSVLPVSQDDPWLLTQMRGEYALHRHEWDEAIGHFHRLLQEDPTNSIAVMGLSRAYRQLGMTEESQEMQLRSLILARLRPALQKVTETDFEAAEELARECSLLGFEDAEAAFLEHAERMRESNGQ